MKYSILRVNPTGEFPFDLALMYAHLTSNNVSGKEQIPPEKQLLLLIWYISNQESMREAANLFGISIFNRGMKYCE
jgi:hypothetical protein